MIVVAPAKMIVAAQRVVLRTKAKLRLATEAHVTGLQTQPERMRAFFDDSRVRYAARWVIHSGSISYRLRRNDTD